MTLTKLEMIRFGQFRNYEVTLQPGFMARQQDNEAGKTTTADFIRFMFYGLPYRGRKTIPLQEDLLEKYQPWDSEEGISGAMEFVDERGKAWRVERTQTKKGKGEHRLLDADGNRVEVADVGQTFLGLDSETFTNVFFVRESGAFRRTEQMEIAMRNLVTTGNEAVGYDSVMKFLLEERSNYVSAKGNAGKLKRLEDAIGLQRQRIAVEQDRLAQQESLLQAAGAGGEQLTLCEQELEALAAAEQQAKAYEAWQQSKKRAELEQQAEALTKEIEQNRCSLTETQVQQLREGFVETEGAAFLLQQAQQELHTLQQRAPEWSERDKQILSMESVARISGGIIAGIALMGGLTAAAAVAALLWQPWCWAVAGGTLLLTALASVLALRLPKGVTVLGIRSRAGLRVELARVKELQAGLWQFQREQATAAKAVEERKDHIAALERKYGSLRTQTGVTDREMLEKMLQGERQADVLRERLQNVYARLDELGEAAEVSPVEAPTLSLQEIQQRRAQLQRQKDELQTRQVHRAGQAAELERDKAELAALSEDLEEKCRQAEEMRRANDIVGIAIEQMAAAQAKLRENYAPRLRAAMSEKLALLTDGKYDTVMLDEELSVRIKADGGMRELGYFSSGTADAAMLALRLSLAEILEGEKSIPMIFDDPFLHLDPTRLAVLNAYLQKAGTHRQILLMSCREI